MEALLAAKVQSDRRTSRAARGRARSSECRQSAPRLPSFNLDNSRCRVRRDQRVRDRLRDGPKRLQARSSTKSPLQTAFKASTLDGHELPQVQGLLRAERRRSRTYPAWGCQTSPVLKPQRAGHADQRGSRDARRGGRGGAARGASRTEVRPGSRGSRARLPAPSHGYLDRQCGSRRPKENLSAAAPCGWLPSRWVASDWLMPTRVPFGVAKLAAPV